MVATPTTYPFSICATAVPMVLLYEGAVLFAIVHGRRAGQRRAARYVAKDLADRELSHVG